MISRAVCLFANQWIIRKQLWPNWTKFGQPRKEKDGKFQRYLVFCEEPSTTRPAFCLIGFSCCCHVVRDPGMRNLLSELLSKLWKERMIVSACRYWIFEEAGESMMDVGNWQMDIFSLWRERDRVGFVRTWQESIMRGSSRRGSSILFQIVGDCQEDSWRGSHLRCSHGTLLCSQGSRIPSRPLFSPWDNRTIHSFASQELGDSDGTFRHLESLRKFAADYDLPYKLAQAHYYIGEYLLNKVKCIVPWRDAPIVTKEASGFRVNRTQHRPTWNSRFKNFVVKGKAQKRNALDAPPGFRRVWIIAIFPSSRLSFSAFYSLWICWRIVQGKKFWPLTSILYQIVMRAIPKPCPNSATGKSREFPSGRRPQRRRILRTSKIRSPRLRAFRSLR